MVIWRLESGAVHGVVAFERSHVSTIIMSDDYAAILLRKSSSPLLVSLSQARLLKEFSYQANFCCFSPDGSVLMVHAENNIYYHDISSLQLQISVPSVEVPLKIEFGKNNRFFFVLSKDTRQVFRVDLKLERRSHLTRDVIQDHNIKDIRLSQSMLLVCSSFCIYVIDCETLELTQKLNVNDLNLQHLANLGSNFTCNRMSQNEFTGFGLTGFTVFATLYTNLVCFDLSASGSVTRVFQSGVDAIRIISSLLDSDGENFASLLEDGHILIWNLKCLEMSTIKFEEMKVSREAIEECALPQVAFDSSCNSGLGLSRALNSSDILVHSLRDGFNTEFSLMSHYEKSSDEPLTVRALLCRMDSRGLFAFILSEVEQFAGKKLPEEKDFTKRVCSILNLKNDGASLIDQISFIARGNSRFEIEAEFLEKSDGNVFLLLKITSCINDFDPFYQDSFDWTEFETTLKVIGPLSVHSAQLLADHSFVGQGLSKGICVIGNRVFASLNQECHKLYDKANPSQIKAKRFQLKLNLLNLFAEGRNFVQSFGIEEFLPDNLIEKSYNMMIDIRSFQTDKLLIIYSKSARNGDEGQESFFEYDYQRFEFIRSIQSEKGALIYDPLNNKVLNIFPSILSKRSNIEILVVSREGMALDSEWSLYDINRGVLLRVFDKSSSLNLSLAKFILQDRYVVAPTRDMKSLLVLRTRDSLTVSSFIVDQDISCVTIGEQDRTILIGTRTGEVIALKLLIDLEHYEATKTNLSPYRIRLSKKSQIKRNRSFKDSLKNDLKLVVNSEQYHRRLLKRETSSYASISSQNKNIFEAMNNDQAHNGVIKRNICDLSKGTKSQLEGNISKACQIQ